MTAVKMVLAILSSFAYHKTASTNRNIKTAMVGEVRAQSSVSNPLCSAFLAVVIIGFSCRVNKKFFVSHFYLYLFALPTSDHWQCLPTSLEDHPPLSLQSDLTSLRSRRSSSLTCRTRYHQIPPWKCRWCHGFTFPAETTSCSSRGTPLRKVLLLVPL
jgi:hypothetical protein